MNVLILTTLLVAAFPFEILLHHGEERTLMWPVSPTQNLLIDCESYASSAHFFTLKVYAVGVDTQLPLIERLIPNGRNHLQLTVPHPQEINNYNHYAVTLHCQSHNHHDEMVWNLVSLQLHSNFDHIIDKNSDPKLTEEQRKYEQIAEQAAIIYKLAEQHVQVQQRRRQEEDTADQAMAALNSSVVWYTILELIVILVTIITELFCLKSFLHRHKVI